MAELRVDCINKLTYISSHEGITHLGGPGWRWTRQQVIYAIETGMHSFYTLVDGNRGNIGVVNGSGGKYLRTYADGEWNDNLLSLPVCLGVTL